MIAAAASPSSEIGHCETDEVRHGWQRQAFGDTHDHGREQQTDRVVHEQRREQCCRAHDKQEQHASAARIAHDAAFEDLEKPRELEVGEHDHHSQEKENRVEVDGALRGLEVEDTTEHHGHRTEEGSGRATEMQPRNALQANEQISDRENDGGDCQVILLSRSIVATFAKEPHGTRALSRPTSPRQSAASP
jgi:hypothetical protein